MKAWSALIAIHLVTISGQVLEQARSTTSSQAPLDLTQTLSDCTDMYDLCGGWSAMGYCSKYESYMRTNCQSACGFCLSNYDGHAECNDDKAWLDNYGYGCADWAGLNCAEAESESGKLYSTDMRAQLVARCPVACGICTTVTTVSKTAESCDTDPITVIGLGCCKGEDDSGASPVPFRITAGAFGFGECKQMCDNHPGPECCIGVEWSRTGPSPRCALYSEDQRPFSIEDGRSGTCAETKCASRPSTRTRDPPVNSSVPTITGNPGSDDFAYNTSCDGLSDSEVDAATCASFSQDFFFDQR